MLIISHEKYKNIIEETKKKSKYQDILRIILDIVIHIFFFVLKGIILVYDCRLTKL